MTAYRHQCERCLDTGLIVWGSTAMGSGIGGQAMREGPCPGSASSAAASNCPIVVAQRKEARS